MRGEFHLRQDIPFQFHPGSNLGQEKSLLRQPEDSALGDKLNVLMSASGISAGESDLLDHFDKLLLPPFLQDDQPSVPDLLFQPACGKRADKPDFRRVLTDVDKTAGTGTAAAEPGNIDIAGLVNFRSAEEAIKKGDDIKSAVQIVEMSEHRMYVKDTDKGKVIQSKVENLKKLLYAYRNGLLK